MNKTFNVKSNSGLTGFGLIKAAMLFLLLVIFQTGAYAAPEKLTGKVTSATDQQPLPGVTVVVTGAAGGTVTDIDGNYTINVEKGQSVVFSFVGYKSQTIVYDGQAINVALAEDSQSLDEVVVIGYGVQKKKLVTGATVQVAGEDLAKLSTTNALGALQSQTPGVNITQTSGQPGSGFKVTVRGLGTIGTSTPLYVIDGVAGGDINVLNPSDIETVDVLKDAASAAIYGARAANGVILVTTKQGKSGKMTVTYDGYYGVQNVYKMPSLLNASQYMTIQDESAYNMGNAGYDWASIVPGDYYQKIQDGEWEGTDWLEEMRVKNAPIQNHSVNIVGGSETSKASLGFSYASQDGIMGNPVQSEYDRYTARLNTEFVIWKNSDRNILTVGENLNYSYNTNNGIQIGNIYANDIHNALVAIPIQPLYDDNGKYTDYYYMKDNILNFYPEATNPVAQMDYRSGHNLSKNHRLQGNAYLVLEPIEKLKFKSSFGYNMSANSYRQYQCGYYLNDKGGKSLDDRTQQSMGLGFQYQWENTIAYNFSVGSNMVDVVLGQSIEKYGLGEGMDVTNSKLNFSSFDYAWLSNTEGTTAGITSISGSPWGEGALASFFGRINYNYNETYLASFVMRADGSSNFARGNRWGYFPSVSAGWVVTNESFMEPVKDWMNFFKIRGSWGQNGNCNINNFQYIATVGFPKTAKYSFDNSKTEQTQGGYQDVIANPDISWETSEQLDLGFDARFLSSRLGVAFDWYKKTTKDWLVVAPQLLTYGTGAPFINGGDVENKGFELALNWNDKISDFSYGINLNLAANKNEVTRIANAEGIIHGQANVLSQGTTEMYRAEVGEPIGYFWGYKTAGIYQNQAEIDARRATGDHVYADAQPGDVIFLDLNHDGKLDDNDKTNIGNPHPDYTLGFSLNFGYKGFDLTATATGAFGQQIAKSYRSFADSEKQNYTTEILDRWHGEGTSNKLPRLTPGSSGTNWQNISDIYIEDGDYLKISNITLGYDFKTLFPKMPLQQARLYFTVQNLYTFTNYSGMDPEIGYGYGESWVSGIDLGYYPSARTMLVGLNLKF